MISELVNSNSNLYFLGYESTMDNIKLLFDIYNGNVLTVRFYYTIKNSPIPELLKDDHEGLLGDLFDPYNMDLPYNRVRTVKGNIPKYFIRDICYRNIDEYPVYIYIINNGTGLSHNKAITIPDKFHYYISFVVYLFQEELGEYDAYRKYVNWLNQLNINDGKNFINDYTSFRTHHKKDIIRSSDNNVYIETNDITFESVGGTEAFDFLQLVDDSKVKDTSQWGCELAHAHYFEIRKRRVTVTQHNWDVFKLISGKYNRYVFLHYDKGNIEFVVPNIVN